MNLRFEGRVAIVTGAGNGLGRSHAMEFARRGAKVVVNDLGGSADGNGADQSVAQMVVDEIKALGGEAIVNTDSVESGGKIIQNAMDCYGRVDILVNNAGILRDASFAKMTEEDWDLLYRVHLLGAFRVTRAAWPHMRNNGFGRVIMTTSIAGIYGNFGQANYSAFKLGLFGLAQTLAIEGKSKNISVNTIAPTSASRLTAKVLAQNALDALKPSYVTPAVILLAHESCAESGKLFEVGGGWISQTRWEQTQGLYFPSEFTAEDLLTGWDKATSFQNARHAYQVSEAKTGLEEKLGVGLTLRPQ